MKLNDFIFSNKAPAKYLRHIAFWLAWYLFPVIWDLLVYGVIRGEITTEKLLLGLAYRSLDLVQNVVYCYSIVYYLVPEYLNKQKPLQFISLTLTLTLLTFSFFLYRLWYIQNFRSFYGATSDPQLSLFILNSARSFITDGSVVVLGFFLTINTLKGYYQKLEEKANLIQETSNAELHLLKAQVHPHFLFNTLNNIYSFTLNNPKIAAGLVLKLSHTIKYMTYDCEAELVPLKKEIEMINDYIGLEKVRYGQRLDLKLSITGDSENKLISPLLLIPFVENSFKHGSSKMLEYAWIDIHLNIMDDFLDFSISNSKPQNIKPNGLNGLGLTNVRKRLQLLYPGQHLLEIRSDEHSHEVKLKLPLHRDRSKSTHIVKQQPALAENYETP